MVVTRGVVGGGVDEEGKGGQICGDGRRINFGWWALSTIYKWCIIELYTRNLWNDIKQCHPNKCN